jgi:hypothetical protein
VQGKIMLLENYPEFLSADEVKIILDWLDHREYTKEKTMLLEGTGEIVKYRNKNTDFQLPDSLIREIVYPKLQRLFNDPTPTHNTFLESHYPFGIHLDTVSTFERKNFTKTSSDTNERAVLIALNQSPSFRTVFFDFYADDLDEYYQNVPNIDALAPEFIAPQEIDLSHLTNKELNLLSHYNIELAGSCPWETGMAISWSRRQLHCSSNFYTKGVKKALVMFF